MGAAGCGASAPIAVPINRAMKNMVTKIEGLDMGTNVDCGLLSLSLSLRCFFLRGVEEREGDGFYKGLFGWKLISLVS